MEVCRKPAIASHLEHCLCTAPPEPGGPKWTVGAGDRWIIFSSKLPQHLILRLTHSPTCVLCHEKSGKKNPGILAFRKFNKILCVELFYSVVWRAVDLELKSMWHHVFRKKNQIHVSKIILSRFKCELAESSFSARYTFEEAVCTQWFIHYFGGVGGCVCCFLFSLPVCLHFNNCLLLNRQY